MIRRVQAMLVVCALAPGFTAVLAAQKHPDFSGIWVEDESQRKSPYDKPSGDSGGVKAITGPPPPLTITLCSHSGCSPRRQITDGHPGLPDASLSGAIDDCRLRTAH